MAGVTGGGESASSNACSLARRQTPSRPLSAMSVNSDKSEQVKSARWKQSDGGRKKIAIQPINDEHNRRVSSRSPAALRAGCSSSCGRGSQPRFSSPVSGCLLYLGRGQLVDGGSEQGCDPAGAATTRCLQWLLSADSRRTTNCHHRSRLGRASSRASHRSAGCKGRSPDVVPSC